MNLLCSFALICAAILVSRRAFSFHDVPLVEAVSRQTAPASPVFRERSVGFTKDRIRYKYGAPMIADLDGDGWDDIVIGEHENGNSRFYLRESGRSYTLAYEHPLRIDYHGMAAYNFDGEGNTLDVILNQGGVNGRELSVPDVFKFVPGSNTFVRGPGSTFGIGGFMSRGRAVVVMDVDLDGNEDIILTGRTVGPPAPGQLSEVGVLASDGIGGWTLFDDLQVKDSLCYTAILAIDLDDDAIMDLVCSQRSRISVLRGTGTFPEPFEDVTLQWLGTAGASFLDFGYYDYMADLDYDNDGKMDVYLTCGLNFTFAGCNDILLRNDGSKFVDVSRAAGIPMGGVHQEPATGDFNLDGYTDILIPVYGTELEVAKNILLINQGDGTFVTTDDHGVNIPEPQMYRGAGASAIQMNRQGHLDVVMGYEGNGIPGGGPFKFYRNTTPKQGMNFLAYKVNDVPSKKLLARGAKVTVQVGNLSMIRRIGSAGGESQSFQRRVHFGIGEATTVDSVSVEYLGGLVRTSRNVRSGFRG